MNSQPKKLHLACGLVYREGWINVDLDSPVADILTDFRNPLPFSDSEVQYIVCEHFIEHLTQDDAKFFLGECLRVLEYGGVIRMSTPSLRFLALSYLYNLTDEWGDLWAPPTLAHLLNQGMRLWGHEFIYDGEELTRFLLEIGFHEIRFCTWSDSDIPELRNMESRPFHNELIVEAKKINLASPVVDMSKLKVLENEYKKNIDNETVKKMGELEELIADLSRNKAELENHIADLYKNQVELENYATDLCKDQARLENHITDLSRNRTELDDHQKLLFNKIKELEDYYLNSEAAKKNRFRFIWRK